MNRVIRHNFLRKYPIVLVNDMSTWANGIIVGESYYQKVKFSGRPLSYIIMEVNGARRKFGFFNESLIAATLSIICGSEKFPNNPKLATKFALEKCVENSHEGAYNIVKEIYEKLYGKCDIVETDWNTPHQTDKLGDQFSSEDEIDAIIRLMDDEIEGKKNTVDEADYRFSGKKRRKEKSKIKIVGHKSRGKRKHKNYVGIHGGSGNLYVYDPTGRMTREQASKHGATHKEVNGRLIPIQDVKNEERRKKQEIPTQRVKKKDEEVGKENKKGVPNPHGRPNPYGGPNPNGEPNPYGEPNPNGEPNPYGGSKVVKIVRIPVQQLVVVYYGNFKNKQNDGAKNYMVLANKFGKKNVYIGIEDDSKDGETSASFFTTKNSLSNLGIPEDKIFNSTRKYDPQEVEEKIKMNPSSTAYVVAIEKSQLKDFENNDYFEEYKRDSKLESMSSSGYYYIIGNKKGL